MSRGVGGALVLAGVLLVSGCGFLALGVSGSGFVVEQDYGLGDFDVVEAASGFSVDVLPGDSWSVVVRTDDNILPHVVVRRQDARLLISLEPGFGYFPTTLRAIVTLPALSGLELSGGSVGYVAAGFETTGTLRLTLSGGSSASVGPIGCGSLDAELSGGSTLAGEISCPSGTATMVLSGGSEIGSLSGEASVMSLEQSGGGETDLSDFAVQDAEVTLSGGGQARVAVASSLGLDLSGGSSLEYRLYGTGPVIVSVSISGGSEILAY